MDDEGLNLLRRVHDEWYEYPYGKMCPFCNCNHNAYKHHFLGNDLFPQCFILDVHEYLEKKGKENG